MSHKSILEKLGGTLSTSSLAVAFLKFQIPIPKSQGKLNRQIEKDRVVYSVSSNWSLGFGTCGPRFTLYPCPSLAGQISKFCLDRLTSFSLSSTTQARLFLGSAKKLHPVGFLAWFQELQLQN